MLDLRIPRTPNRIRELATALEFLADEMDHHQAYLANVFHGGTRDAQDRAEHHKRRAQELTGNIIREYSR